MKEKMSTLIIHSQGIAYKLNKDIFLYPEMNLIFFFFVPTPKSLEINILEKVATQLNAVITKIVVVCTFSHVKNQYTYSSCLSLRAIRFHKLSSEVTGPIQMTPSSFCLYISYMHPLEDSRVQNAVRKYSTRQRNA